MNHEEFIRAAHTYAAEVEDESNWFAGDDIVDAAIDFLLWLKNGGLLPKCQNCNAYLFEADRDEDGKVIWSHLQEVNCDDPTVA